MHNLTIARQKFKGNNMITWLDFIKKAGRKTIYALGQNFTRQKNASQKVDVEGKWVWVVQIMFMKLTPRGNDFFGLCQNLRIVNKSNLLGAQNQQLFLALDANMVRSLLARLQNNKRANAESEEKDWKQKVFLNSDHKTSVK